MEKIKRIITLGVKNLFSVNVNNISINFIPVILSIIVTPVIYVLSKLSIKLMLLMLFIYMFITLIVILTGVYSTVRYWVKFIGEKNKAFSIRSISASILSIVYIFMAYNIYVGEFSSKGTVDWISAKSKIKLPHKICCIDAVQNDSYALAHVTIRKKDIDFFFNRYTFKKCKNGNTIGTLRTSGLKSKYQKTAGDAEIYHLSGSGYCSTWEYFLDKKNGDLWMILNHMDNGGDCP